MANRDLNNFREVTKVVADETTGALGMAAGGAMLLDDVMRQSQEAKINENFAKAQLELNALQEQYKIDYEGDPKGGLEAFRTARNDLFSKYSEGISPLYKSKWNEETRRLGVQSDITLDGWGVKQTRVNTVQSVNNAMQSHLMQANIDGANFGAHGDPSQAFLNLEASVARLKEFGYSNLGETSTNEMLSKYRNDYVKMFISGLGDANPHRALELLNSESVKSEISDAEQWVQMRDAMSNRAARFDEITSARAEVSNASGVANVFTGGKKSYAELVQSFDTYGVSPDVAKNILKIQGYGAGQKKLSDAQKQMFKADVYSSIYQLAAGEKTNTADVSALQAQIIDGVAKGAITEKEGLEYTNLLVKPALEKKEAALKDYSDTDYFDDDLGFVGVQKIFDDSIAIKQADKDGLPSPLTEAINSTNKSKLYDYYFAALKDVASSLGTTVDKVQSLPEEVQRRHIYHDAQVKALEMYKRDISPSLSVLPQSPDAVLRNGELIVVPKTQKGEPPKTIVKSPFSLVYKDGFYARKYEDGTIERVN